MTWFCPTTIYEEDVLIITSQTGDGGFKRRSHLLSTILYFQMQGFGVSTASANDGF